MVGLFVRLIARDVNKQNGLPCGSQNGAGDVSKKYLTRQFDYIWRAPKRGCSAARKALQPRKSSIGSATDFVVLYALMSNR